jgi:hypothetical protein
MIAVDAVSVLFLMYRLSTSTGPMLVPMSMRKRRDAKVGGFEW